MPSDSIIPTPWPIRLRRWRHQVLPLVILLGSAMLACWIWISQSRMAAASGEVEAIRLEVHSNFDGILQELPRPVNLFDTVHSGQIVARLDVSLAEAELRRLQQELDHLQNAVRNDSASNSSIQWHQARIDELLQRIENRDIKAPISGTVVAIHRRPGEAVTIGRPIMTIAADKSTCIVGYLREDQIGERLEPGALVQVRTRTRPAGDYRSRVLRVGAQVELLPWRHWRNPQVAEWGLPVQIAMPDNVRLVPGQLVDLFITPAEK